MDIEKKNQQLENMLKDKSSELNKRIYELENSNIKVEKLLEDNKKLFNEIEKLKNHINVLTDQNYSVKIINITSNSIYYIVNKRNC